ncbi:MAG: PstS family phosphate ABC transporter substrate-binding protein [Vicinamibacteria bacterium]|nr:PstS family phosphate ABC transporter substrate-binding protein [Vicinamibacteria bacterium]
MSRRYLEKMNLPLRFAATVLLFAAAAQAQTVQVDPALPSYQKVSGVSGNLNSIGSDTMNNLMTLWAEAFTKMYPNVKVQVEGKGSSTAPPALIAGTAQFGPMSRAMRSTEIDQFERKYGYKPVQLRTAYDALAVYVSKDNPLEKLTLAQVDAAFSKTRRRGYKSNVITWGDLGLTGDWARRPVSLYGRNSASGTYGFFKEHAMNNGDYKDNVKEQPGSASVVQGVTGDRFGMGYSGIGYRTSGVKAIAIAEAEGKPYSSGSYDDVKSGKYPLNRFLFLYVNQAPDKPADPLVREFLKLIFSKEGQEVVLKDGYLPLPADVVKQELAKIR